MVNEKLKKARLDKNLSQGELAKQIGVYNPTISLCIKICKILDKTLDELFWEV